MFKYICLSPGWNNDRGIFCSQWSESEILSSLNRSWTYETEVIGWTHVGQTQIFFSWACMPASLTEKKTTMVLYVTFLHLLSLANSLMAVSACASTEVNVNDSCTFHSILYLQSTFPISGPLDFVL